MSETVIETTEATTEMPVTEQKPKRQQRKPKAAPVKSEVELILEGIEVEVQAGDEEDSEGKGRPLNGGNRPEQGRKAFEQRSREWREFNDARRTAGTLGWDGLLLEDTFRAASAEGADALAALEQVAATAVSAMRSLKLQLDK